MPIQKVIAFENIPEALEIYRKEGKRVVQCHGTFDLIHPGHIVHFEEAKALGDVLVVTITGDDHVNKGPGRPHFNEKLRCKSIAALESVDIVATVPYPAAVEAINQVRPDVYCKGKEYENSNADPTGNMANDVTAVERLGAEIQYVGSVVFSSSKLLNNHFEHLPEATRSFCRDLAEDFPPETFRKTVEDFAKLKILVIGDIILDRYSYVQVQGLASKNRVLSTRFIKEDTHLGGALAIYRHLRQFSENVDFASIAGTEPWLPALLDKAYIKPGLFLEHDETYTTIIKQRFVELSKRSQELGKIFSINYIDPQYANPSLENRLIGKLAKRIADYDLVVVGDFGHGLMTQKLRDFVQAESPFLSLNCQTNSYNHGYNLISRQYQRVNAFSIDEHELMLDRAKQNLEPEKDLRELSESLGSKVSWITRGAKEAIGVDSHGQTATCVRLENQVVDTIGAGDAFFSLCSLAAKCDLPIALGTFLGQLAGAQAVKIVGNEESVNKAKLIKGGMTLLNF